MVFRFSGFELDPKRLELRRHDGDVIRLRPKTFTMLQHLAENAGRVVSKQDLMKAVWPNVHVGEDNLFQCIRELRTALCDDERRLIKAISGRGYLFDAEVTRAPADGAAQPKDIAHTSPEAVIAGTAAKHRFFDWRRPLAAVVAALCAVIGIATAAPIFVPDLGFKPKPPTIAVMPIAAAGHDPDIAAMAANLTGSLTDGLARLDKIRVVAPQPVASTTAPLPATAKAAAADLVLSGDLQRTERAWELRARLTRSSTREVTWTTSVSVAIDNADVQLQQSRLTAGLAHRLAGKINADRHAATRTGNAGVVVDQAKAAINQTTRERFAVAQTMLERALAEDPQNVDLEVALSAHMLRGLQMAWYSPDDSAAAESKAKAMLQRALRTAPDYLPVHEAYCRFLSATNQFVDAMVACARALTFDPWNGLLLYNLGLVQIKLGRFEDALATFVQADRYDTPEVSRWTWLLGAGWAQMLLGRDEAALPWLQRSIAITPASGRSHFLLAAAYQRLGQPDEAKAALAQTLALRPGSTAGNIAPPQTNTSRRYVEASTLIIQAGVAAGLPEN
jgi:DNA-binding winged helix-turn-helix (wHTH) protein/tetratricopeptide (TPR) repeat protein